MRRLRSLFLGAPVLGLALTGCTRGHTNDAGAYCDLLRLSEPALNDDITNTLDIAAKVSAYQQLRDGSPLEVEADWQAVIDLVESANTVDLSDQAAVIAVQDQALSTARSAEAIVAHAARVCGITMPVVGQLTPPSVTISVPETTDAEAAPPAT